MDGREALDGHDGFNCLPHLCVNLLRLVGSLPLVGLRFVYVLPQHERLQEQVGGRAELFDVGEQPLPMPNQAEEPDLSHQQQGCQRSLRAPQAVEKFEDLG